ncbi:hypothetical protein GCM10009555_092240 [Acrocarpospora macrocephala]|uniref:Uncharacterized protein n=1 Tax=Acrocarpospora macrocephala TaxID=150177 RepID=A0A5M3WYV4_9ACTN|nr:hypothetical protein Amac_082840 [Acrocarpospora macrocephala]
MLFGLIALPVLAADTTATVRYTCGGSTYPVTAVLDGPDTNPTPSATITVKWRMAPSSPAAGQATDSYMTASTPIAVGGVVVLEGDMTVTGVPISAEAVVTTPAASATAQVAVAAESAMSPIPELAITLTPTAAGTLGIAAGDFLLELVPAAGQQASTLYDCTLVAPAATLAITVATSSSSTDDPDDTTTATTTSTVFETETVMETETVTSTVDTTNTSTVSVTNTAQVGLTPVGGAQTGGGGTTGPDGRMITLFGTILILAAASGGLLLRHRQSRGSGVRGV